MRTKLNIVAIAGLVTLVSAPAFAQDSTTGAVRGEVKDVATGESAIGATVVITSPALQGTRTEITDESGSYYLSNLPPGDYLISVQYLDVRVERTNVLVRLGQVSKVNINVNSQQGKGEVVRVEGRAPLIDQQSTKTGTTVSEEYTKNVPTGRTFGEVLGAASGSQDDTYGVSFSGSTSVENTYIVEGINTTDPGFGQLSSNLPNEFVRETEIITGGYNAEYGRATGGIVNVITKSGSNEFHGSVFTYFTPGALELAEKPVPRSANALDRQNNLAYDADLGAELGGPIVKDRLWFHVGFNPSFSSTDVDRIIQRQVDEDDNGIPDIDENGFTVFEELDRQTTAIGKQTYFYTAKLTGAVNENHQGSVSVMGSPNNERTMSVNGLPSATRLDTATNLIDLAGKWTSKFNDNETQLDAVVGYHYDTRNQTPQFDEGNGNQVRFQTGRPLTDFMAFGEEVPAGCSDTGSDPYPGIVNCPVGDIVAPYRIGGVGFLEDTTASRVVGRLDFTQRLRAVGHHEFKAGVDMEQQGYDSAREYTGSALYIERNRNPLSAASWRVQRFYTVDEAGTEPCGSDIDGDMIPDSTCGVRDRLDVQTNTRNLGAYARDSWSVLPNLTFNAGLRWEQQVLFSADEIAGQISPTTGQPIPEEAFTLNNMLAPRLGVIYDPTQEGRSRIYGNWGRFYESIPMDINVRAYGGEIIAQTNMPIDGCDFNDPIGTCDETGRTPNLLGGGDTISAPGLKAQYMDEMVLGGEYEVLRDIKVGASYIRRDLGRVIEDVSFDGGNTYIIANPSEADSDKIAAIRDEAADLRASGNMALADFRDFQADQFEGIASFDPPSRTYNAVQITAEKRYTNNWYVAVSYTYSKTRGNFPGLFSPETGQLDPNLTSMYDLPELMANRYGDLAADRPHQVKIDGFYTLPVEKVNLITFGGRARGTSGLPHNALGSHPVYGEDESYILPRGETVRYVDSNGVEREFGRSPFTTRFDTHIAYGRQLRDGMVLEGFIDVFNLFNQQPEVDADESYTADTVNPIVGGDSDDLRHLKSQDVAGQVAEQAANFGNVSARQAPLSMRFGLRLTF